MHIWNISMPTECIMHFSRFHHCMNWNVVKTWESNKMFALVFSFLLPFVWKCPPAHEENGTPTYSFLRMWAQRADAWTYSADLPQHVKSAALLAGAHCPKDPSSGGQRMTWGKLPTLSSIPWIEGLIGHSRMQRKKKYENVNNQTLYQIGMH
jgi:hypothetical protein